MKLLAAFLAALVTAGMAGASGVTLNEHQLQQTRAVVKQTYINERYDDFRLDLLDCNGRQRCIQRVEFAYYYSEQWPGWEAFRR